MGPAFPAREGRGPPVTKFHVARYQHIVQAQASDEMASSEECTVMAVSQPQPASIPMRQVVATMLSQRGVSIPALAQVVLDLQRPYAPDLTLAECEESLWHVLDKREVQNAVLTGLALDMLAEKDMLPEPLGSMVRRDDPLYGIDEILPLSIVNVYGTIGLTNFGYLDKVKPGPIGGANRRVGQVNTFLDDLISALAAAAAARIAHRRGPASP